jgi:hypothetical protein
MKKFLPLLAIVIFSGCEKGNDATDLLTRSWQITAMTMKTATGENISRIINNCDDNRIYTFRQDGSFLSEPSAGCILNGSTDVLNGTWTLIEKKILKVEARGGSSAMYLDADIVMLTKSKLVLRVGLTADGRAGVRVGGGGFAGDGSQLITEFSAR